MTGRIAREAWRWLAALAPAGVVLTALLTLPQVANESAEDLLRAAPDGGPPLVWTVALSLTALWLALVALRTARQPILDRRAADHLQNLRDRAALPGHRLVCLQQTLWTTPAGEKVVGIDVRNGAVCELWLSEAALPTGTYALVTFCGEGGMLVDWLHPKEQTAARRAERAASALRTAGATRAAAVAARRERSAAARVVRAAERLVRES